MRAISLALLAALAAAAQPDAFVTGLEAFRRGDYAAAERSFRASDDARAKMFLALTEAATSRCQVAEPYLEKAFAAASADLVKITGLALAQCRIATGSFEAAAPVIARLRASFPRDADVLYQAARLRMRQWNDTIQQLYREAPSSFRVNQISGEVLETQGRYAEAAAEFRKALDKNPQVIGLHYRLARSLLLASHSAEALDTARKEFQAELGLNPFDPAAHFQIAQILILQGHPEQAVVALETAIALDPKFVEPRLALGRIRLEQKNYDTAIAHLRRAAELAPASENAHYSLMMAYRNAGRMDDARREKAVLDNLQKAPEGEFTEFLKRLGDAVPKK